MKKMKFSRVIGGSMFLLALACMALAFLYPGLRMALGYGNGYGYPCDIPEDCYDANDCTNDVCDPVLGCMWTCNATGPQDPCCHDPYCNGNSICQSGPCAGGTEPSVSE